MTNSIKPPSGDDRRRQEEVKPQEPVGKLPGGRIFTQEKETYGWEKWIPRDVLFGNFDFTYKAERAWEKGVGGIIVFVALNLARQFGWRSDLAREQNRKQEINLYRNLLTQYETEKLDEKSENVRFAVQKVVGDEEEQLRGSFPKNRDRIPEYLQKLHQRRQHLEDVQKNVPYAKEAANNRLQDVNDLIQQANNVYLGQKTEELSKRFSNQPHESFSLFSVYREAESAEKELAERKIGDEYPFLQTAKQNKLNGLQFLKQQVAENIRSAPDRERQTLENAVSSDLKNAVNQRDSLQRSAVEHETKLKEAENILRKRDETLRDFYDKDERNKIPEQILQLETSKQIKLKEQTPTAKAETDKFLEETKKIDDRLKQLDKDNQRYRELDKKIKDQEAASTGKKVFGFITGLITGEKEEWEKLRDGAVARASEEKDLTDKRTEIESKYKATSKKREDEVKKLFDEPIAQLRRNLQDLPQKEKDLKTLLDEATKKRDEMQTALTQARTNRDRNETFITSELNRLDNNIRSYQNAKIDKEAFEEFKSSDQSAGDFIQGFRKRKLSDPSFQREFSEDLRTLGLPEDTLRLLG